MDSETGSGKRHPPVPQSEPFGPAFSHIHCGFGLRIITVCILCGGQGSPMMLPTNRPFRKWLGAAAIAVLLVVASVALLPAIESGLYRILSVSESIKVILVSQIPNKTKYVLDAATAKVMVDGKPAELKELKFFASAQVKFELKKSSKEGIDIDGVATEIRVTTPGVPK
jgi:hypothetical protein